MPDSALNRCAYEEPQLPLSKSRAPQLSDLESIGKARLLRHDQPRVVRTVV